jgi:hypothetical protein
VNRLGDGKSVIAHFCSQADEGLWGKSDAEGKHWIGCCGGLVAQISQARFEALGAVSHGGKDSSNGGAATASSPFGGSGAAVICDGSEPDEFDSLVWQGTQFGQIGDQISSGPIG